MRIIALSMVFTSCVAKKARALETHSIPDDTLKYVCVRAYVRVCLKERNICARRPKHTNTIFFIYVSFKHNMNKMYKRITCAYQVYMKSMYVKKRIHFMCGYAMGCM